MQLDPTQEVHCSALPLALRIRDDAGLEFIYYACRNSYVEALCARTEVTRYRCVVHTPRCGTEGLYSDRVSCPSAMNQYYLVAMRHTSQSGDVVGLSVLPPSSLLVVLKFASVVIVIAGR